MILMISDSKPKTEGDSIGTSIDQEFALESRTPKAYALQSHFHALLILAGTTALLRQLGLSRLNSWRVKLGPFWNRLIYLLYCSMVFFLLVEGSPLAKESHFGLLGADESLWFQ